MPFQAIVGLLDGLYDKNISAHAELNVSNQTEPDVIE
jgi:hypothetical protein